MQEHYTLVQAARLIGVTPRILVAWLKDAGITTRKGSKAEGLDARAQYVTRAQVVMLAAAHGRTLPDDASLAALASQIQTLAAELDSMKRRLAHLEQGQNTIWPRIAAPAPLQSQPGLFSAGSAADLADTLKRPRVTSSAALRKIDAARLVAARHGVEANTAKGWPWPAEALVSEEAALRWALGYVGRTDSFRRPRAWRPRCNEPGCPCQQQEQG